MKTSFLAGKQERLDLRGNSPVVINNVDSSFETRNVYVCRLLQVTFHPDVLELLLWHTQYKVNEMHFTSWSGNDTVFREVVDLLKSFMESRPLDQPVTMSLGMVKFFIVVLRDADGEGLDELFDKFLDLLMKYVEA